MLYGRIKIVRNPRTKEYEIEHWDIDGDRIVQKCKPHSSGFCYYPKTKSPRKTFEELRLFLIKQLLEERKDISKAITKLRKLEWEPIGQKDTPE